MKILGLLLVGFILFSCGDSSSVDETTFNSANIKYNCPVCHEKSALFCTDCDSPNLIWCQDGRYVNSIGCKDCSNIMYPTMYTCFSCERDMRSDKSCFTSKTDENHPDCQAGINAEKEFDDAMQEAEDFFNQY